MLVFPAETADSGLTRRLDDGNIKHLATNLVVTLLALLLGEVDKSLIRDGFHKAVAHKIQRNAEGANFLRIRHSFLNFRAGESGIRADGAVVHERASFDDLRSTSDGDFRILKFAIRATVSHAQFGDLARAPGSRILVALAAGLRVIERAEAVGDLFDFIELDLVGGVGGVVDQPIGLVVVAGRGFSTR